MSHSPDWSYRKRSTLTNHAVTLTFYMSKWHHIGLESVFSQACWGLKCIFCQKIFDDMWKRYLSVIYCTRDEKKKSYIPVLATKKKYISSSTKHHWNQWGLKKEYNFAIVLMLLNLLVVHQSKGKFNIFSFRFFDSVLFSNIKHTFLYSHRYVTLFLMVGATYYWNVSFSKYLLAKDTCVHIIHV